MNYVCVPSSEKYRGGSQSDVRMAGDGVEEDPDTGLSYKKIQEGGDIPIRGLQKPAPEKPKSE